MNWIPCLCPGLVLVALAPAAAAQTRERWIGEGDPLPSGDHVSDVDFVRIDDRRGWIALADTDRADPTRDGVVLRNGVEILREGALLGFPPGSELNEFDSLWWDGSSLSAIVRGRHALIPEFEALLRDGQTLALENELVGLPGVSAQTTWLRFHSVRSSPRGPLFALCDLNDPDRPGLQDSALVRFDFDGTGNVSGRSIVLVEGQVVPALGEAVTGMVPSEGTLAVNTRADFVVAVQTAGGGSAVLWNLDTVLARSGTPSPSPGRNYRQLGSLGVSLNDVGEHAFGALLDGDLGTDACIIENGRVFVQEGDRLPAFGMRPLDLRFQAPLYLAKSGDLFWGGRSAGTQDEAFLRNDQVIVQRNKTRVGRSLVTRVDLVPEGFHVSPDGRYFLGRVELEGSDAVVFVDFGLVAPIDCGGTGNLGSLRKSGGDARVGSRLSLELDQAQAPGALATLVVATRPSRRSSPECGLPVPGGTLLYDPTSVITTIPVPAWTGAPSTVDLDIPPNLALVDLTLRLQGRFVHPSSPEPQRLTRALRVVIGAP